jgi:membrane protein DedA with SNARE-associated domain
VLDYELIWALVVFFGMCVAAGLGAPIPEELAIIGAGLWAASNPEHGISRFLMLPVCIVGVVISDILLYGIGRFSGSRLLHTSWMRRLVPEAKQATIRHNFHRYGISILVFGRLLPGIRAPLFITAGMLHLSIPLFILADGLGAVLGNSLLFFLAFWFGDQFRELVVHAGHEVRRVRPLLVVCALAAVSLYFLYIFVRRPVPTGDPKELPLIGQQVAAHISAPADCQDDAEEQNEATAVESKNEEGIKN